MKKLVAVFLAGSALSLASAASAADLSAVAPAGVYDWSGFYAGLQAGGGWTTVRSGAVANLNGIMLGAHAGYNFQHGSFVYGLEADLNYNFNRTQTAANIWAGTPWDASVRARLGYALDRTLFYVTGGVAFTNLGVDRTPPAAPPRSDVSFTGWTAGAGVEHAFTGNMTARIEYRYTDFGQVTPAGFLPVNMTKNQLLVGVSYKF